MTANEIRMAVAIADGWAFEEHPYDGTTDSCGEVHWWSGHNMTHSLPFGAHVGRFRSALMCCPRYDRDRNEIIAAINRLPRDSEIEKDQFYQFSLLLENTICAPSDGINKGPMCHIRAGQAMAVLMADPIVLCEIYLKVKSGCVELPFTPTPEDIAVAREIIEKGSL